ncbi:MAG: phosphate/phosphite/phosphonate ABC transporter substrate-binding protein [Gammaproteobacteria bacterium]|nr:phosphate/phosphite/phosphonate ABC transporter substrate-binding protein [Gammaproteobacteria bacterium]
MKIHLLTASFLVFTFMFSTLSHAATESAFVTLAINHDDGGRSGKRHSNNLLSILAKNGCPAALHDSRSGNAPQLLFNPHPISLVRSRLPNHRLIAQAKTLNGKQIVRGAIVVRGSTGINNLKTLQGEPIAFVGKNSWSGHHLPLKLLNSAGVHEGMDTFFFVGNHIGVMSMLLHGDVFVAAIAEPLAHRWKELNDLNIVAVTDEVETGGWWMQKNVSEEITRRCADALTKMKRSQHKALPAWIDGFINAQSLP